MTTTVFLAVLAAATLHAVWNALVKGGIDKRVSMAAVVLGSTPPAVLGLVAAPAPDLAALPYMGAALVLHVGYQLFLMQAYAKGDLTQVYPIARGSAPLIVALVSVLFLGVVLGPGEVAGVVLIGTGVLSLALVRRADGVRNGPAAGLAFATGLFIAAYSLVDGLGARVAGSSVGYYSWVAVANGAVTGALLAGFAPGILRQAFGAGAAGDGGGRDRVLPCLRHRDLGLHAGAHRPRDRAARDEHPHRARARRRGAEGAARPRQGRLHRDRASGCRPRALRAAGVIAR